VTRAAAAALVVLTACRGDAGCAASCSAPPSATTAAPATAPIALAAIDAADAPAWARVEALAQPTVPPASSARLDAAVAAQQQAGGAASERTLVELQAWADGGGGLPRPDGPVMDVVPRGMTWLRLGEDLLADARLRARAAAPLLYLAHRMRAEGPTVFEVTLGQSLAVQVVQAVPDLPNAARLAPTDAEVVRALAADALFSVRLGALAGAAARGHLAAELPLGDRPDLRPEDVAALRAFHTALFASVPDDGSRAAWLARIDQVADDHADSPSIAVRRVAEALPEVAARMFQAVDAYAAALSRRD